jgi:hypothetical protein
MTRSEIIKLAEATRLLLSNQGSATAREITKKAYGDLPVPWRNLIPGVIRSLKSIKKVLCDGEEGLSLCLVSDKFFTTYKRQAPKNMEEARRCIANGPKNIGTGIYMAAGDGDFMLLVDIEMNARAGGGTLKKVVRTIAQGEHNGHLAKTQRNQLLLDMKRDVFSS